MVVGGMGNGERALGNGQSQQSEEREALGKLTGPIAA